MWNREQFGNIQQKLKRAEQKLSELGKKEEDRDLTEEEIKLRKELQEEVWVAAHSKESIIRQKTRIKWLKEGDCNSRFYHMTVNWKQRKNMLRGIFIGGCWVEEPNRVREEVK